MTQQNKISLLSPVGRMVQGHPFEFSDKNFEGKPLVDSEGNGRVQYFIALAIPKNDPDVNAFWAAIQQIGMAEWPTGEHARPDFAWKIEDGDSDKIPQGSNVANKDKVGFAGNWVFKFQGGFQPKVYDGKSALISDPKAIKRGDYIRVYCNVNGNNSKGNPGVFLNPVFVQLCGFGEEIVTGPDAGKILGAAPAFKLPPGASPTPVAPTSAPGMPGSPATTQAAPPALPPGGMPVGAAMPPASPATLAMPAIQVRRMLPKAGAYTYEQYVAQGWKDADLISQGYMVVESTNPGTGVTPAPSFLTPGR